MLLSFLFTQTHTQHNHGQWQSDDNHEWWNSSINIKIGMKTHHDGVLSSVIDIVEGRMIDTNTLIENERKEGENWGWFWLLLKMSWLNLGFEIWEACETRDDRTRDWCGWKRLNEIECDEMDVIIRDVCDTYD